MKNIFISLLLIVVGIAALMLIPSKQAPAPMPWEVTIMQDG
ncbi:MAG: lytic murein transglycosylase, partial [Proteobacteria bacterium]|nr:lytic murein transglycosylase [Pseudomonadota bacterium]